MLPVREICLLTQQGCLMVQYFLSNQRTGVPSPGTAILINYYRFPGDLKMSLNFIDALYFSYQPLLGI